MKHKRIIAILLLAPAILLPAQANNTSSATTAQTSQPVTGPALSLDDLIREALDKNPEAQSAQHTISALQLRVPQVKALPDPMVSIGWAGNLAPFSLQRADPSSSRAITVSEQFPYPGKLRLRGEIASKDAEAAQSDFEAIRRRVAAEVKAAYYDYFFYNQAIQTTERNKELLEKLSKIAEARYRVGKATQSDVLRSQVEISLLIEKLTMLEQQRATAQTRINVYLLRSPESPLPPATDLQPSTIRYSLDELYALAAANDTTVLRNKTMIEQGRIAVELAHREYRPDIGVSYMYQQRSAQPDMNGLTFNVNVPIFYRNKQRQGVAQATETLVSAERMRDSRLNEIRFELKQQYLNAKASERLLTLYSKGIVPQSSLALESSMASYQVGNVDFLSLLANFSTLLQYEMDYYRQLVDYQTALGRIEALTGSNITGSPDPGPSASGSQPAKETH